MGRSRRFQRAQILVTNGNLRNPEWTTNYRDSLLSGHAPDLRRAEAELVSASASASRTISEGLVSEDGNMLYPISDGIPLLVPEEGIPFD